MQAVALLAQHKRNKHERTEADMTLNFTTHFDKKGVGSRLCLAEDEKASNSLASNAKKPYLTTSPTIINGAELLDTVHTFIKRFVAFPSPACIDIVTLWTAHAHMVEHFHTTPRLAMLSPEPESGKTRVLEILDLLTPRPMLVFSPSVAAIFRKLAREQITLLFDEVDTIFTKRGKDDQNQDLQALLNGC